ncbi:GDSL-type esterase/lipase family protein [Mucilaginibacter phyllosphaerae]
MIKYFLLLVVSICLSIPLRAQNLNTKWRGFERVNFTIDGHKAWYVKPSRPLAGKPWVWRASFPDWHTDIDSLLLAKGMYVAYVDVDDQYGSPQAMQVWDDFYNYLLNKAAFAPKPALEAVSRGALYAYGWAKRNPDKVSSIYAETPVCDFKSWPGGKGKGIGDSTAWQQLKKVYQFTQEQALAYKDNPVDNLEGLASFKVPLSHIISNADKLVPPNENTYPLIKKYKALGGQANVIIADNQPQELYGHHFNIEYPEKIADFLLKNTYPVKPALPYTNYSKLRNGANNFMYAVTQKRVATVAFLGGSITFNPGWRDKVCSYLKERFPKTKFRFIAAGIPSLGSLPHVFRLKRDLLDSGKIDLLFIETAVNDRVNGTDSLTQVRNLEGIVRHAKRVNPLLDVVMMSFADPDKTNDYNQGKIPAEVANHELIAGYYNLPSINLAKEVRDKLANKEFNWNDDFKDLHPSPFGQELYFANIKSLLQKFEAIKATKPLLYKLPQKLNSRSFTMGNYQDINTARYDNNWVLDKKWAPGDKLDTRPGFVNVPVLSSEKAGAQLTLSFKGTAVGMVVVSGADAGIVSYAIDNGPYKDIDLYTPWSSSLHLPWYILFSGDLKRGHHLLKLKIADKHNLSSTGTACRIVYFLRNE